MSRISWIGFEYREFYDVPRSMVVRFPRACLLFESRFDDKIDDYENSYNVYRILCGLDLLGSWDRLAEMATELLGTVPVHSVIFDETKRQAIKLDSISHLVPPDVW